MIRCRYFNKKIIFLLNDNLLDELSNGHENSVKTRRVAFACKKQQQKIIRVPPTTVVFEDCDWFWMKVSVLMLVFVCNLWYF